jgi:hypothetical protein
MLAHSRGLPARKNAVEALETKRSAVVIVLACLVGLGFDDAVFIYSANIFIFLDSH